MSDPVQVSTVPTPSNENISESENEGIEAMFSGSGRPLIAALRISRVLPKNIGGMNADGPYEVFYVNGEENEDYLSDYIRKKYGGGVYEIRALSESGKQLRRDDGVDRVSIRVRLPGMPKLPPEMNENINGSPALSAPPGESIKPDSNNENSTLSAVIKLAEAMQAQMAQVSEVVREIKNTPAPQQDPMASLDGILRVIKLVQPMMQAQQPAQVPAADPMELLQRVMDLKERFQDLGGSDSGGDGDMDSLLIRELIGIGKQWMESRNIEAGFQAQNGSKVGVRVQPAPPAQTVTPPEPVQVEKIQPEKPGETTENKSEEQTQEGDGMLDETINAILDAIEAEEDPKEFAAEISKSLNIIQKQAVKAIDPSTLVAAIESQGLELEADEKEILNSEKGQNFIKTVLGEIK